MKCKYRLFQRRTGIFFVQDNQTGRQESLRTRDKKTALRLFNARNEAHEQPAINLQIAKAYLAAADSSFVKRTWREVMAEFIKTKRGSNRLRSERAVLDTSFDSIRDIQLIETRPEHFLKVLQGGKVSTNNYLRRFHNFALDIIPSTSLTEFKRLVEEMGRAASEIPAMNQNGARLAESNLECPDKFH